MINNKPFISKMAIIVSMATVSIMSITQTYGGTSTMPKSSHTQNDGINVSMASNGNFQIESAYTYTICWSAEFLSTKTGDSKRCFIKKTLYAQTPTTLPYQYQSYSYHLLNLELFSCIHPAHSCS